jgi:hypothetical protein
LTLKAARSWVSAAGEWMTVPTIPPAVR